jgi:hypothetical protein
MSDVPPRAHAFKVLLEHKLAANRPSDFERRISAALRDLKRAIMVLRDAIQADPRGFPVSAHDPRRQSSAAQDVAAEEILRMAAEFLPKSRRIQVAMKAAMAQRRADGRRAVGDSEIDDRAELIQMARLMIESGGNKLPKTAAAEVARQMPHGPMVQEESVTTRLYRKYRDKGSLYDALAAAQMREEIILEGKRLMASILDVGMAIDEADIEAICRGNEEIAGLVERIKSNAETVRVVEQLTGTRKSQNKSPD